MGNTDALDEEQDKAVSEQQTAEVIPARVPKKKSKKKKEVTETEETDVKNHKKKRTDDNDTIDMAKRSKKKKRTASPGLEESARNHDEDELNNGDGHQEPDEPFTFPIHDLPKLIRRIEAVVPENDTLAFRTREKKINWEEIAFKDYTGEMCRNTWLQIQKKQRHYRLLGEVIDDAKKWMKKPWTDYRGKMKQHPDFPKKALSSYMLFYLDQKDSILNDNPGITMTSLSQLIARQYNDLPESSRVRYVELAMRRKQEYDNEVEMFYEKHPDIPRNTKAVEEQKLGKPPPRPGTPFILYYQDQLKKEPRIADKVGFRDTCKDSWKNMSDKKKLVWINYALELKSKYDEDNPNVVQPAHPRDILTKEEKQLKNRLDGRPEKPPNSAYSLYSQILLKGNELKDISNKDRMRILATKWKEVPQIEKDHYRDQINLLNEQYKKDFASYLESLPEEKREIELKNAAPKKRIIKPLKKIEVPVKKTKVDYDSLSDSDDDNKHEYNLTGVATPDTWEDMKSEEKEMYVRYLQKIKDYFDIQHQTAARTRDASSSSDSESDSDMSSNV